MSDELEDLLEKEKEMEDEEEKEEESTEEDELDIVKDRVLSWLSKQNLDTPVKRSELLQQIEQNSALNVYVSPTAVIRALEEKGLIKTFEKSQVAFENTKIKSLQIDEDKEYKNDVDLVVDKVIFWMKDNTDMPNNYHQFAHALTSFCELKHEITEDAVLHKIINEGYLLDSNSNEGKQNTTNDEFLTTTAKLKEYVSSLKKESEQEKKSKAWKAIIVLLVLIVVFLPMFINWN